MPEIRDRQSEVRVQTSKTKFGKQKTEISQRQIRNWERKKQKRLKPGLLTTGQRTTRWPEVKGHPPSRGYGATGRVIQNAETLTG
jgi:hypothetical protein